MLARPAALSVAGLFLAGLLAGCEKPLPEVAALADGKYTQAAAALYCFDGDAGSGSCRQRAGASATVSVHAGGPVAIEVPQEVRDRGWYVRVVDTKGQVLPSHIQHDKSYFRLSADFGGNNRMKLQVVALPASDNAASGQPSGVWEFNLVNADAG